MTHITSWGMEEVSWVFFLGHPSNLEVTWAEKSMIGSDLSKITRPVAAVRSLRFALFLLILYLIIFPYVDMLHLTFYSSKTQYNGKCLLKLSLGLYVYMQTCCTHRIYNHSVVNVCGISGELQVSNNENVFKRSSPWSGKIHRNTQIPDT